MRYSVASKIIPLLLALSACSCTITLRKMVINDVSLC